MVTTRLSEIAKYVNGELSAGEDVIIENVTTASRDVKANSLFVAIKGERFDGHNFIADFFESGGTAVIASDGVQRNNQIQVNDTKLALGDFARSYREKFNLPIIGITGSAGKTSTRQMIEGVLKTSGEVLATKGNLNNDIGLPMTLLSLEPRHKFAVIEMGMNHLGEIGYLSKIAKPDISVITNIGTAHIGNLGSKDKILEAKLEISEGLSPNGLVVLNGDDELLFSAKNRLPFRTIYYGIDNNKCDIIARNAVLCSDHGTFCTDDGAQYHVPSPGKHNILNALAAVAIGREFSLSSQQIAEGISSFKSENMRQNIFTVDGITIIEDCYNANPDSMKAALEVLAAFNTPGAKIAVLGDMYELGGFTNEAHALVGEYAAKLKIDLLVTVGELGKLIALQAEKHDTRCKCFNSNDEAASFLKSEVTSGDVVLLKASRSAKFEEISERLTKN